MCVSTSSSVRQGRILVDLCVMRHDTHCLCATSVRLGRTISSVDTHCRAPLLCALGAPFPLSTLIVVRHFCAPWAHHFLCRHSLSLLCALGAPFPLSTLIVVRHFCAPWAHHFLCRHSLSCATSVRLGRTISSVDTHCHAVRLGR
ncbi:hypothetical protein KI387_038345, partial [Taxus chinensis]